MNKSYHEMILLPTFYERFNYLQLYGKVGVETFGENRYLNQNLYHSPEWQSVRDKVIVRDRSCDLAHPDYEIFDPPVYIHHINPITPDDILERSPKIFDLDNLVLVSFNTHHAIHYGSQQVRKLRMRDRTSNDTCPWKKPQRSLTLIIGLPGSGKTTLAKELLRGGLCYDLDALAGALKLSDANTERGYSAAKKVANALLSTIVEEARKQASNVIVVRTAPNYKELYSLMPDKVILCKKQWVERPYSYDRDAYLLRINEAMKWAANQGIQTEIYPKEK